MEVLQMMYLQAVAQFVLLIRTAIDVARSAMSLRLSQRTPDVIPVLGVVTRAGLQAKSAITADLRWRWPH